MKELHAALAQAMGELRGVHHDARNKEQGYDYTSTEAVVREVRRALAKCGLSFVRVSSEYVVDREPAEAKTRSGSTYTAEGGWLVSRWLLCHSSGQALPVGPHYFPWATGPGRPRDKALGAAYTSSLGEALRSVLLIDRPDEPECAEGRDDSDDSRPVSRQETKAPAVREPDRSPGAQPPQKTPQKSEALPEWVRKDAKLAAMLAGRPIDSASLEEVAFTFLRQTDVPSESGPGSHRVERDAAGAWSCGCKGYATHKGCRHCDIAELAHRADVLGDRWMMSQAALPGLKSEELKALLAETAELRVKLVSGAGPWAWNGGGK